MVDTLPGCSCCFPSCNTQKWMGVCLEWAVLASRSTWTNGLFCVHSLSWEIFCSFLTLLPPICLASLLSAPDEISPPAAKPGIEQVWAKSQLRRICRRCCCALFPLLCTEQKGNQTPATIRRDNLSVSSTCLVPSEGIGRGCWKAMSSIPAMSATLHTIRGSWRNTKENSNFINHFSCAEVEIWITGSSPGFIERGLFCKWENNCEFHASMS